MSGTDGLDLTGLDPRITLRSIPRVFRSEKPRWEVLLDETPIGYLRQTRIGRTSYPFYEAVGYFPGTGEEVSLELSPYVAERCRVLADFHASPQSSVHLPYNLRTR